MPESRTEHLRVWLAKNLFSPTTGFVAGDFWRLIQQESFQISPRYLPRALLMGSASLVNTVIANREHRRYGGAIHSVQVPPPLFILGHWRSGTTHLHNLLSQDQQFCYPNVYEATQPHIFLSTEHQAAKSRILQALSPQTRVIDNVEAGFEVPMEDEVALAVVTGLSPVLGSIFPKSWDHYQQYISFADATEAEVILWKAALDELLRKLTLRYDRAAILKSPPHTARIRLLLDLYPDARFIHIRRHPYRVFLSYRRSIQIMNELVRLQTAPFGDLDSLIMAQYQTLYDAYFEQRHLIPANHLFEMSFEDLERDPIGSVQSAYQHLGLSWEGAFDANLRRYTVRLAGFRQSRLPHLEPELKRRITDAWGRNFTEWDYPEE